MQTQNSSKSGYSHVTWWDILLLVLEFGFVLGVPLVLFARIGHELDVRLNHDHCYDVTGILLALLLGGTFIGWRIRGARQSVS